jgi:restriction endonuclease S subunit
MANNNDKKVLNVPALRFPEFTGEWENITIREACSEFQSGKNIKAEMINDQGLYPVYGGNGLRGFTGSYNHDGDYILIGRQGALCGNVRKVTGKTYVTEHAIAVCASKEHETTFLQHLFQKMRLGQYSDQSAQPGLAVNKLLRLNINVPSKNEQGKIAKILSLIDERITTQNKIIEKYESLIQAICDTLIEAEQHKVELSFNDFGEPYSGLSGKSAEDFGEGCQYITYINVYQNQIIDTTDVGLVKINETEQQSVVRYGDILFTLSSETPNEVGMGAVYLGDTYPLYLNSFCFGVRIIDESKIFPPFLAYYISTKSFRKAVFPLAQGSTRFNLQKSDFMKKMFLFPKVEKQNKIYTTLKAYSDKLSIEKRIAKLLCEQKSFLLRKLFI